MARQVGPARREPAQGKGLRDRAIDKAGARGTHQGPGAPLPTGGRIHVGNRTFLGHRRQLTPLQRAADHTCPDVRPYRGKRWATLATCPNLSRPALTNLLIQRSSCCGRANAMCGLSLNHHDVAGVHPRFVINGDFSHQPVLAALRWVQGTQAPFLRIGNIGPTAIGIRPPQPLRPRDGVGDAIDCGIAYGDATACRN